MNTGNINTIFTVLTVYKKATQATLLATYKYSYNIHMTATPTAITIDEVSWQDNKNDCIIGNSHDKRQETRQSQLTLQYAWFYFFTVSSFYIPPKNTGNVFLWVLEKVLLKRPVSHFSKKLFHENIFCFLTNFLKLLSFF